MDTTTALIIIAASILAALVAIPAMYLFARRSMNRTIDRYIIDPAVEAAAREDRAADRGRYIIR